MVKKWTPKKIFGVIRRSLFLRIFSIMNIVLIILITAAMINASRFKGMIQQNEKIIEQNKKTLEQMERTIAIQNAQSGDTGYDLFSKKSFAGYDEVIPFIALLEKMFSAIDPEAIINLASSEDQMPINRYADYSIRLKIGEKKELFYKTLDEIENSRFITKINDVKIQWEEKKEEGEEKRVNKLSTANFTIRLFLN